ncbi:hypothetical protein KQX54_007824 [Cotesia glomerata]|uniref:Uncharacterized protein n=1 Tax=Cotesia glomerata TaxID=32391 RepID=A0AAV7HWW8_COTGL|nr:hypothetical protein KQX54_007824 [Cotesia glomerata]
MMQIRGMKMKRESVGLKNPVWLTLYITLRLGITEYRVESIHTTTEPDANLCFAESLGQRVNARRRGQRQRRLRNRAGFGMGDGRWEMRKERGKFTTPL